MPRTTTTKSDKISGISSEAVAKATGKTWDQWLTLLDKAGAAKMSHKEIAALLHDNHGLSGWWSQSVAVGYEQARGLRKKHEQAGGFQISASKTMNIAVERAFDAWMDDKLRRRWLPDAPLHIRKATPGKSIRITWDPEGKATNLDVYFTAKSETKCLVAINHGKLQTAAAGEEMKAFWGPRLDALKQLLEA